MDVPPLVRHMLLCHDVRQAGENWRSLDILGLTSAIFPEEGSTYPLKHSQLCVFLQLAGGRGVGKAQIVAVFADTDDVVWTVPARDVVFGSDPLPVTALVFRVRDCVFPAPGLYWIQFRYNGQVLAEEPLRAR